MATSKSFSLNIKSIGSASESCQGRKRYARKRCEHCEHSLGGVQGGSKVSCIFRKTHGIVSSGCTDMRISHLYCALENAV